MVGGSSSAGRAMLMPGTRFGVFGVSGGRCIGRCAACPSGMRRASFFASRSKSLVLPRTLGVNGCHVRRISTPFNCIMGSGCIGVSISASATFRASNSAGSTVVAIRCSGTPTIKRVAMRGGNRMLSKFGNKLLTDSCRGRFICGRNSLTKTGFGICTTRSVCATSGRGSTSKGHVGCCDGKSLIAALAANGSKGTATGGLPLKRCEIIRIRTPCKCMLGPGRRGIAFACISSGAPIVGRDLAFSSSERGLSVSIAGLSTRSGAPVTNTMFNLCTSRSVGGMSNGMVVRGNALLRGAASSRGKGVTFIGSCPFTGCITERLMGPTKCIAGRRTMGFSAGCRKRSIGATMCGDRCGGAPAAFRFAGGSVADNTRLANTALAMLSGSKGIMSA